MAEKKRRHCHNIKSKLHVVAYAKEHGNRGAEQYFGPPPTEKKIRMWRKQDDDLKAAKRSKHCLHRGILKWPELEEELKISAMVNLIYFRLKVKIMLIPV